MSYGDVFRKGWRMVKLMMIEFPLIYLVGTLVMWALYWSHHYTIALVFEHEYGVGWSIERIEQYWPWAVAVLAAWIATKLGYYFYKARQIGDGNAKRAALANVKEIHGVIVRGIYGIVRLATGELVFEWFGKWRVSIKEKNDDDGSPHS